ncbi:MAG: GNAT family N-acetyltransferase [Alphaproteobacteria bacterium]|nr:GNAT family N-acetyltransferase [Alphaproteobacteria bacterium]MDE2493417.1 GNAT family N-acetyltransferase [Alphaproteobacteria bacterium]
MSAPKYLIDTNVFIKLEDAAAVSPEFALLLQLTARHGIGVFIHEAAVDDISRDQNFERRRISLSKLEKFQKLSRVRGLDRSALEARFGRLQKPNDIVDATLLHALHIGVADFLVTEDQGLHDRARKYAADLVGRVLYVADAVSLLRTTYEPLTVSIPFVEEVDAHSIPLTEPIFTSLREGYPEFDDWWRTNCVKGLRKCWVVMADGEVSGLVVRKTEEEGHTDAKLPGRKILKICTFKVRSEQRGIKLGELLLKQILWFAQTNGFDLTYVTTFSTQSTLIDLITYYGFKNTYTNMRGELVYEKSLYRTPLGEPADGNLFDAARLNYPRFYAGEDVTAFGIPIREPFHEVLFPELAERQQGDLFEFGGYRAPNRSGNTIRKVYLCRAPVSIEPPGAILFFYKGKSHKLPSQAITTVGIFENMSLAHSTEELRRLAGGRSVYSSQQLDAFGASEQRPVKVLNFLLVGHINPPISLPDLLSMQVFSHHPPQSIVRFDRKKLIPILEKIRNFGFHILV